MDERIFEAQRAALVRLIAAVFAVMGFAPDGPVLSSLSADMRRRVLRILSASESALRRLIFYRARSLRVKAGRKRGKPSGSIPKGDGSKKRPPLFALFDPRKWFAELAQTRRPKRARGAGPNISSFDDERRAPEPPAPEAEINPAGLCRRLQALHRALHDIEGQAKRLARLQARRRAAGDPPKRTEPRRPGWPPGYRRNRTHPVDAILWECDVLSRRPLRPPDTS